MARTREADRAADWGACEQALAEVRCMIGHWSQSNPSGNYERAKVAGLLLHNQQKVVSGAVGEMPEPK
jgi:hypothetical protein